MSKKKIAALLLMALLIAAVNVGLLIGSGNYQDACAVSLEFSSSGEGTAAVYWSQKEAFSSDWCVQLPYTESMAEDGEKAVVAADVTTEMKFLRLDVGAAGETSKIYGLEASYGDAADEVPLEKIASPVSMSGVASISLEDGCVVIEAEEGAAPQVVVGIDFTNCQAAMNKAHAPSDRLFRILMLVVFDGTLLVLFLGRNRFLQLPRDLVKNRALIVKLAKNDFKTKYAGSYLGIVWAFVQPVVTVLVYWLVFSVGFRSSYGPMPFVMYLVCGIVPWFFIQDFMNSGTNAMLEYSYLVKKVVFNISILPMVKAISAAFVHVFFVALAIVIAAIYGYYPSIYLIQLPYYFLCMFVFGLGLVYGTCAVVIFFRDLSQVINIFLQIGVWTIPIMWNINIAPARLRWIFKINPMYYVVNGYREAIYGQNWFWNHMGMTLYFWVFTLAVFAIGMTIFKRLKVHFADVL